MTRRAGTIAAVLVTAVLIAMLLVSARTRAFDPDEFQHAELAWLIARGVVPYRDVFEHHTPLYHFIVAPFLSGDMVMRNGNAAVSSIISLRWAGVASCVVILALTRWLTRLVVGRPRTALAADAAMLILASMGIFALKGLEIRPDQLAATLLLGAVLALVLGARHDRPTLGSAAAGACAMLSILTTQKTMFAIPGLAVAVILLAWGARWSRIIVLLAAAGAGAIAAAVPLLGWLLANGALMPFIHDNFLLGAVWPHNPRPLILIGSAFARDETLTLVLAAIGLLAVARLPDATRRIALAAVAPMLSMVVLMPLFPVVQAQYMFLFLPYIALLGGIGIAAMVEQWASARTLMALTLTGAVAVHGALTIKTQSTAYDDAALQRLRYTVERTPVDATVLRGWTAGLAFRRPAFAYFSLNDEIRSVIAPRDMAALATGLTDGTIAPALVQMDDGMRSMPAPVVAAIQAGWEPTPVDGLWRRKAAPRP